MSAVILHRRKFDHAWALARFQAGYTYAEIAQEAGVSQTAIRRAVIREGHRTGTALRPTRPGRPTSTGRKARPRI